MGILWFIIISYILLSISLYFVFEKAGIDGKKGLIPGVNFVEWCKLIGRKPAYALWLLFPIVNIFIFCGMAVDLMRSFGKYDFWHSAIAVIYAPAAFLYLWKDEEAKYLGPTLVAERSYAEKIEEARASNKSREYKRLLDKNPYKKSVLREWTEAIVFAVFAAAFIRMFLIEAYTIPTSSMEGSLNVGDFLFVSKAHYGIRTPKTVAMFPLLHNRVPYLNTESYLDEPSLDFRRLPAIESIDRNDPVVFNYPEGDSVYVFPERTFSIHDYRRGAITPQRGRQIKSGKAPLITRPIDKKDHYIKRCVAIAGDSIQVKDRQLFVNGKAATNPTNLQFAYLVEFNSPLNTKNFFDWGISQEDMQGGGSNSMVLILNEEQKQKVQALDPSIKITPFDMEGRRDESTRLFPHDKRINLGWSVDNYGPIWVPKKGVTININRGNISTYKRVITVYEGNDLRIDGNSIFINGEETKEYTFKMDYYWMMGDNRHNSEDSRVWGFVPQDHVVGKPLFIWFSLKEGSMAKGINWSRIFTNATKM